MNARKVLRLLGFLCLAFPLLIMIGACTISFDKGALEIESTKRENITVETSEGNITLSYLRTLSPKPAIDGGPIQRVIFIHGTPGNASGWSKYIQNTPPGFDYIAIDRPGFGHTMPKRSFTSLKTQAEIIKPFLDIKGELKPILVGHSLGGPIIAKTATLYSDEIGALIEVAGSLDPDLEEVYWIQYLGLVPPFSWALDPAAKHSNEELINLEGELEILKENLDQITTPIVIIHSDDDELVPFANVSFMEDTLTRAEFIRRVDLTGVNHFLPWNSEDIINREIYALADYLNMKRYSRASAR